jgi:hypothetical protein
MTPPYTKSYTSFEVYDQYRVNQKGKHDRSLKVAVQVWSFWPNLHTYIHTLKLHVTEEADTSENPF